MPALAHRERPTLEASPLPSATATRPPASTPSPTAPSPARIQPAGATPLPGGMLFADDFASSRLGWDEISTADGSGGLQDGRYVVRVHTPGVFLVARPHNAPAQVDDLRLEYTATLLEGGRKNAALGGLCRYIDPQNFYAFWITPAGYYSIEKFVAGQRGDVLAWRRSAAIVPDLASNRVSLTCSGSQLTLLVNGTLLARIDDEALSTGGIGLAVETFDEGGDVVGAFDDLAAWQPDAPTARPRAAATARPAATATATRSP